MRHSTILHRKTGAFHGNIGGFLKSRYRNSKRQASMATNQGELSRFDVGATFTEPSVYTNTGTPDTMIRYHRKVNAMARSQDMNRSFAPEMDDARMAAVEREGGADTAAEKHFQSRLDAEAFGFGERSTSGPSPPRPKDNSKGDHRTQRRYVSNDQQYSNNLHRLYTRETPIERKQRILTNNAIEPTEAEFGQLMRRLAAEDEEEGVVEQVQERLVEESGIYPSMRMDAYMLGDESAFPPWVHKLAPAVRDRVKFGGIGLTEDDEALRIRLSRMPLDARRVEWQRLKAARSYEAGVKEQRLSPTDIRQARLAKRQYFRLQQQRQHRATMIRRLGLRKPEEVELIPSHHVDYSARLATIAQFVENGVDTKGQWPLDRTELQRAKIRNQQEAAERTFLRTADEKKMLRKGDKISTSIHSALEALDDNINVYKRVSRKTYAHRVNNIVQGVGDDLGRMYKYINRQASYSPHAKSNDRVEMERRMGDEPNPNVRRHGLRVRSTKHWQNREASFGSQYEVPKY